MYHRSLTKWNCGAHGQLLASRLPDQPSRQSMCEQRHRSCHHPHFSASSLFCILFSRLVLDRLPEGCAAPFHVLDVFLHITAGSTTLLQPRASES